MNTYSEGQRIMCTGTFTDLDSGSLVDPTTVRFQAISGPNPTIVQINAVYLVDPNVVRVSLGVYRYDLMLNRHGKWRYGFMGEGSHDGASWRRVYARESPF
jgi:hypothetical protein